jgi:phospholipid/cholesterol/gamma-HCH transport system substrate-binding protein
MNQTPDLLEPLPRDNGSPLPEPHFKFRRVREITGAFVLIVIGLLIATVVWTGRSQRWFKSNVTLGILLPETGAAGIRQGSEVYFLGTRVGSVYDVIVDTNGLMEAQTTIRRDFFRFVRADSSAVVKKKFGVAGDSFFEITRGTGRPLPEKNASIICSNQFQSALESAIEEVRSETLLVLKKTSAGLDTWTQLGADLRETRQHLDQVAVRLDNLTVGVEQGRGTVGKLFTDTALADEATNLLARANQTMTELRGVVTNLNAAVKNVQAGTERLPEITESVANETKDLPGLVLQTQTSMRELERLIEAMQRHWLLRKYVNQTNPPPLPRTLSGFPAAEVPRKPAKALLSPVNSAK